MTNAIIILVVAAILACGVYSTVKHFQGKGGGCCGGGEYKPRKKKLRSVCEKRTYRVEGMMCQNCVNRVTEAINDIPGAAANVQLKSGLLTVSMETPVENSRIIAAVERHGYTVTGPIE